VLLVVEDLHWADSSSLELFARLVDQAASTSVCALFTGRPEFRPPWPPRSHVSQLMLNRLPRRHVEAMLGHLTAGKPLPDEISRQILAKADGVPLFVEELTKTVIGSGVLTDQGAVTSWPVRCLRSAFRRRCVIRSPRGSTDCATRAQ
jgi:predicted ATPase